MKTYDLMPGQSGVPYTVHDVVADIFCVDITDEQADKLLRLCPICNENYGNGAVVAFADGVCHHFVGRGLPWKRETDTSETAFWQNVKAVKDRFIQFITN